VLVFDPCYANVEDFDGHADFQFLPDRVVGEACFIARRVRRKDR
jgi:hypothetical protein